eukprot:332666-Chlamydomonas_euryale.AAC.2
MAGLGSSSQQSETNLVGQLFHLHTTQSEQLTRQLSAGLQLNEVALTERVSDRNTVQRLWGAAFPECCPGYSPAAALNDTCRHPSDNEP